MIDKILIKKIAVLNLLGMFAPFLLQVSIVFIVSEQYFIESRKDIVLVQILSVFLAGGGATAIITANLNTSILKIFTYQCIMILFFVFISVICKFSSLGITAAMCLAAFIIFNSILQRAGEHKISALWNMLSRYLTAVGMLAVVVMEMQIVAGYFLFATIFCIWCYLKRDYIKSVFSKFALTSVSHSSSYVRVAVVACLTGGGSMALQQADYLILSNIDMSQNLAVLLSYYSLAIAGTLQVFGAFTQKSLTDLSQSIDRESLETLKNSYFKSISKLVVFLISFSIVLVTIIIFFGYDKFDVLAVWILFCVKIFIYSKTTIYGPLLLSQGRGELILLAVLLSSSPYGLYFLLFNSNQNIYIVMMASVMSLWMNYEVVKYFSKNI